MRCPVKSGSAQEGDPIIRGEVLHQRIYPEDGVGSPGNAVLGPKDEEKILPRASNDPFFLKSFRGSPKGAGRLFERCPRFACRECCSSAGQELIQMML